MRQCLNCASDNIVFLQTKQYDEVMEQYRSNMYALRRLVLKGTAQQRLQVIYMFMQVVEVYFSISA